MGGNLFWLSPYEGAFGGEPLNFWQERSALQSVAVRLSTGNDISGNNFHRYFFRFFLILCCHLFS